MKEEIKYTYMVILQSGFSGFFRSKNKKYSIRYFKENTEYRISIYHIAKFMREAGIKEYGLHN